MNNKIKSLLFLNFLFLLNFSCIAEWDLPATDLSDNTQNANRLQVAMDSEGNAVAVWRRNDGSNWIVQADRYDVSTNSWMVINLSEPGEDALLPQVAMDAVGNAMAVWFRNDGSDWIVQADRYDVTTNSWMPTATNLSVSGEDAEHPQVAMDAVGNAMAVWRILNGGIYIIQADRYDISTNSWMSTATNLSAPGQHAQYPQVAMDKVGNAMAVWHRTDESSDWIVQADRYDVVTESWMSTATNLSAPGQHAQYPQVAMDEAGNAIAVWRRNDGSNLIVQADRYDVTTNSWMPTATNLSVSGEDAEYPQVAMDAVGNAMAVWLRSNGSYDIVQAKRYDVTTGLWSSEAVDLSEVGQDAFSPQVAMDDLGNAVVVWDRSNGDNDIIQVRTYDVATGLWSDEVVDLSEIGQDAVLPQVAMSLLEKSVVVWQRDDDQTSKSVAQAVLGGFALIENLTALKNSYRFPTQVDLTHCLKWDATSGAAEYKIYLNAEFDNLVATVLATDSPCYEVHNRCPGVQVTYYVVSVDSAGVFGVASSVTI